MIVIVFVLIFLGFLALAGGFCSNSTEGMVLGVVLLGGALVVFIVLKVRGWA